MTAFLDEAVLEVFGGCGGNGVATFLRTRRQPRGGPDGGNGGNGGSVLVRAESSITSLAEFIVRKRCAAENGRNGGSRKKHGANGANLLLRLPVGTDIYDVVSGNLHAELIRDGQEVLLAQGGLGGRGNSTFKSSTNRTPYETTPGQTGDTRAFRMTLRLLADVGLLGLPNAGKSSFLNAISNSTSRIASYPFTTLRPHLGVVELPDYSQLVVADIPGIVSGAAEGAGVGARFLRHISRSRLLLHMVDCSDGAQTRITEQIAVINQELRAAVDEDLTAKPRVLVLTKSDLLPAGRAGELRQEYTKDNSYLAVHAISSSDNLGIGELLADLHRILTI